MKRLRAVFIGWLASVASTACGVRETTASPFVPETSPSLDALALPEPRIWYDPYAEVRWGTTLRLQAQTHDHAGVNSARLLAYDSAGYDFVPLMDYSGVASLPFAQRRRLWPAESLLSPSVREQARNVKAWVPAAEEVGYQHLISLFLRQYIAKWEPSLYASREQWMYDDAQEAIRLVDSRGGFAILAHPWGHRSQFDGLSGYDGIEVYSAFAEHRFFTGTDTFFRERNRNLDLREAWDRALLSGRLVVGVAVNDHHGPYRSATDVPPRVRDSGKIVVLTDSGTLAGFERAMRRGSILAIADFGDNKGSYPLIDSAWTDGARIHIATSGEVNWIVNGEALSDHGSSLLVSTLPRGARYVRAEVRGTDGSTVFLQPTLLRPRGDVNGDFAVNRTDDEFCARVEAGADTTSRHRRACNDRPRPGTR